MLVIVLVYFTRLIIFRKHSNWRKSFQNCRRYCSGVFLVLVLCACVLGISLLFWFSLRLYRDVENLSRRLTIEVNRGMFSYDVLKEFC